MTYKVILTYKVKINRVSLNKSRTSEGLFMQNALNAVFGILIMTISDSHAYLDPGTGSIILQAVVGALFAGSFFFKKYFRKLKDLITKK